MSDEFPTIITLGGEVENGLIPELAELIFKEEMQIAWGDRCFHNTDEVTEALRQDILAGKCPQFFADEQECGEFENLERFLVEHKIDFDRHHSARYEFPSEIVRFRKNMEEPLWAETDDHGNQRVPASSIIEALKGRYDIKHLSSLIEKLNQMCAVQLTEDLKPFSIITSE